MKSGFTQGFNFLAQKKPRTSGVFPVASKLQGAETASYIETEATGSQQRSC